MSPRPRLPDLTAADAGRIFVMRPGSVRDLRLDVEPGEAVQVTGPLRVTERPGAHLEVRRLRIEALAGGSADLQVGELTWRFEIRGAARTPDQSLDDTDAGWGESRGGHSRTWWEEQRPPHW